MGYSTKKHPIFPTENQLNPAGQCDMIDMLGGWQLPYLHIKYYEKRGGRR